MIKKYLLLTLTAFLLTACGGSSGKSLFGDEGGSDNANDGIAAPLSTNTFYPLNLYYSGEGYVDEDGIDFFAFNPLTQGYLISPVDARTLAPAVNPKLSDFELKINGKPPVLDEHLPVFQKVLGLPVQLHTALVIDTSASSIDVEKNNLINEILQFVQKAQASSDPAIKNQKFSLWIFGTNVKPLLDHFTTDITEISTALDNIDWQAQESQSALYQAIVAAVGFYEGSGSIELKEELNYKYVNPKDDTSSLSEIMLLDGYESDSLGLGLSHLNLSNVVLFSSGPNSLAYFDEEAALAALNWQSLLVFDEEIELGDGLQQEDPDEEQGAETLEPTEGMKYSGKPLYYVSLGLNGVPSEVKGLASLTIDTQTSDQFNFSQQLVNKQLADVNARTRISNIYLLRFPIAERDGKVESSLTSRTNYRDYSVYYELEFDPALASLVPAQATQLEITGPNNEYLAGGAVKSSQVGKLYPGVRWDYWREHQSGHSWTVGGSVRQPSADGSISITAADVGKTVVLSNGALSPATIVIK